MRILMKEYYYLNVRQKIFCFTEQEIFNLNFE